MVIVESKSSEAALHHSIFLGQITFKKPVGVFGVVVQLKKKLLSHVAQTRWDGMSMQNSVIAMLVKCALNFE